jgi:NADH-quinone oxidoreductase subunit H
VQTLDPNLWIVLGKCLFALLLVVQIVPLLIWAERKGAAFIQDRPGPNRAQILGIRAGGLVHSLADVVKLIFKEDIVPSHVSKKLWAAAPVIAMTVALTTFIIIPWSDYIEIGDTVVNMQVSQLDGGVLYILAITSLGVYGVMLAGWSSNNKFSLLGGLRSSAQMVSYELSMGFSLVVVFMIFGTVSLQNMHMENGEIVYSGIVAAQEGAIWNWGIFRGWGTGVVAFFVFWIAIFAETNRLPFDLPEAEAELVAGYHTEYSSLRFALFFMAEYSNMIVACAVTATLFFGGYHIPFVTGDMLRSNPDQILVLMGGGGAAVFAACFVIAHKRKSGRFYQSLPAGDPRLKEPSFWMGVWAFMVIAHIGLAVLGSSGSVGASDAGPDVITTMLHLMTLVAKILIGCWIMILVRWTLPRFRYDQLMNLGWRRMLPISMANVFAVGIVMVIANHFGLWY